MSTANDKWIARSQKDEEENEERRKRFGWMDSVRPDDLKTMASAMDTTESEFDMPGWPAYQPEQRELMAALKRKCAELGVTEPGWSWDHGEEP